MWPQTIDENNRKIILQGPGESKGSKFSRASWRKLSCKCQVRVRETILEGDRGGNYLSSAR